jgi:hypothetical protein
VLSGGSSNPEDEDSLPSTPQEDGAGQSGPTPEAGLGHRAKVNRGLFKVLQALGTPGAHRFTTEVRARDFRQFPTVPGEPERNPTLGRVIAQFEQRRKMSTRVGSLANDGPRQDGEDDVNGNNGSHRRRGTHGLSRDTDPGTPPSRTHSGAELSQRRTPQPTLQIPKRTYTSPREATTISTRMDEMDSPVRARPAGVPKIVIDAIESPV